MDDFLKTNGLLFLLGVTLMLITLQLFRTWLRLRHIPGPFLASLTNFQRVWWVKTKRAHLIHEQIHNEYGEIVRIGPNMVSISNPEAIPTVYPIRPGFIKSDFYAALRPYTRGGGALQAVFNIQDEKLHKQMKSPIAPIFSVTSVTSFESLVDKVLKCMSENLDRRFVKSTNVFDLGEWLQFFAFDVMGTMTFSKSYGFLDQGKDVGGMLATIFKYMQNVAAMTQIPWLDKIMYKNGFADSFRRTPGLSILKFVGEAITERQEKMAQGDLKATDSLESKKDFLTRFIELHSCNPEIPRWAVTAWTFSNVIAGSDSVGTVMRTTLFNILAHPHTLEKLCNELNSANLSRPYPAYSEVRDLPYLEACVQEGIRMHPPFALPFERIVPEGGVIVLGCYLPAGTVVGGNPYVVNRHKQTFGRDAEYWRPERWLEQNSSDKKKLEQSMLTFGAGRRICLGKHIGILEVKKLIPFLFLNYDMHIINPKAFTVENSWFFKQSGFYATIEKRS